MIFHETGQNNKEDPRISISGDIMLTMKKGIKSEHTSFYITKTFIFIENHG